jgi:AbiU2
MRASVDPVENLRTKVRGAVAEYDEAVAYHETWRIASNDAALHKRVGHSFAGNTFLVVRKALRRELLLSLARLWDTQTGTVKMHSIADDLENPVVLNALWPDTSIYEEPRRMAAEAASVIREYEKGGSNYAALGGVRTLRNQHLAHRQTSRVGTIHEDKLQEEVEHLYQVSARLISLLEHVVERTAYNPTETAGIYKFYAEFFWEAVRGERAEGHPRYRPIPQPLQGAAP